MIVSRLMGGHSNQLFQYAIGRQLAERHNTNLLLDVTWFKEAVDVDTPRNFELDVYPLVAKTTNLRGFRIIDPRQPENGKLRLLHKLQPSKSLQKYYEPGLGYNEAVLNLPDNSYLEGFWQNEKYFKKIRSQLLKELEPTTPLNKPGQQLLAKIKGSESVWLHIRRGDYVNNKNTQAFHGLKDLAYYQKALELLVKKLPQPKRKQVTLFVCSNDIPWCKQNLNFSFPTFFVENELGSDDMRIVKYCKHDILANSSFSWWGAWLNQHPDKIVIAPNQWFQDKKANQEIEIVPPDWIKL